MEAGQHIIQCIQNASFSFILMGELMFLNYLKELE